MVLKHSAAALLVCLLASPSYSQTSTAVGVGSATSNSASQASSVAIGGGASKATGGKSSSALTINNNGTPSGTVTGVNTNVSGTSTVKNVPAVFAPGLTAAGLETCLGSVSGGASAIGFGATFGTTIPDPGCAARLDARTLWSFGLKKAAVARLCLTAEIQRSMPDVCAQNAPRGSYVAAAAAVTPGAVTGSAFYARVPLPEPAPVRSAPQLTQLYAYRPD